MGILMEADGRPTGGQWSFDADNRKKLPKGMSVPNVEVPPRSPHTASVIDLVRETFADHPGNAEEFD